MLKHFRKRVAVPAIALTIAYVVGGSIALAQTKPPPPKPDQKPAVTKPADGDSGVLAGPKVEPDAQTDKVLPVRQQERGGAQQGDMPFQQWMTALRGLELTEEQRTKVRAISEEFQKAQREYQAAHGDEAQDLMRQAKESREAGTEPPKDLRQKLQKIEAGRPKPGPFQSRIWNELTDAQQELMKTKLEEMRKEMEQRREKRQADGKDGDDSMNKNPEGRRRRLAQPQSDEKPEMAPDDPMKDAPTKGAAAAGDKPRDGQPNERFQRRMKFLRSHQSGNHPNGEPTPGEKQFHFNDQDDKEPPAN